MFRCRSVRAIGAEPYAFILVFAEAVGVVIDVPFAPPPLAVTMAFGGAGRRVVVLIQNIVTEARNVFRDLRALLERLGVVIRLMECSNGRPANARHMPRLT